MNKKFSKVLNLISIFTVLSFTVLSCSTNRTINADLLNPKLVEKRRITPEEGVKLKPMAATVLLQMESEPDIFNRWEDIVGPFMGAPKPVKSLTDIKIKGNYGEIPIRIYQPLYSSFKKGKYPVVLFIHGGGFISGSIKSHDNIARMICHYSESIVVSVDYRLAPDFSYPAAPEDCYSALLWIFQNIGNYGGDPEKLAVAGDSAGGMLAASMVERSIRLGGPKIDFMALYYPALTFEDIDTSSRLNYGGEKGYYIIDDKLFFTMREMLFKNQNISYSDPIISPLNMEINEDKMPSAFIMACQCGPLRDEALIFSNKLKENNIPCYFEISEGMIHGFLNCDLLFPSEFYHVLKTSGTMIKDNFKDLKKGYSL